MAARFSRLFDEWEHDDSLADISMVDIGSPDSSEFTINARRPSSDTATRRTTLGSLNDLAPLSQIQTTPSHDDASTRFLLHKSSASKDHTSLNDVEVGDGVPRQRNGFRSNVQQLWHKKSVLSQRTQSTFDGNFAHGRPGWWTKQMLVDRSLRSMAAFTLLCSLIMFIIIFSYLGDFTHRKNKNTTSVGGKDGESCGKMESRNVAVHLFINIAATMILGCSNTYQQLVTALKVDEIRWVLSKRGDSKVGTNSPWAINHKREGKGKAWAAWILLISTSIPVHFLANSVIGPSFYITMPDTVNFQPVSSKSNLGKSYSSYGSYYSGDSSDSACWTAFRSGQYVLPDTVDRLDSQYHSNSLGNSTTWASVTVTYTSNCTKYKEAIDWQGALEEGNTTNYGYRQWFIDDCKMGTDVTCVLGDPKTKSCRENVRMQAAFILAGCLLIKAVYMLTQNYLARFQTKNHCLTFGDIIVASVLDPDLKVKNECMLNSGDGYRHKVAHTCHKHCKDIVPSQSGDTIGHCQKCKKFNDINMSADLPHPSIAIKYKRSLLSNLGSTAITQMLILMLCSLAMLAASILLIVFMTSTAADYHHTCRRGSTYRSSRCDSPLSTVMKNTYGTWGGFSSSATLARLSADSLSSEFLAFAISNGAQFLYSLLYLLLIYNLTLISMEHEWGMWERKRRRPRCTIVSGHAFEQSYFLQLPSKVLLPLMAYAALMHWLLGQAISTTETIYTDHLHGKEHSIYFVTYASYPIFASTVLMIAMTVVCWWAFTYTREGFIPQMYGSIRACCASTTELTDFNREGIIWGDLGMGERFRHAGFSSDEPGQIIPAELYCGRE